MSRTKSIPPAPKPADDRTPRIVLAHGGGGQLTDELVSAHILPKIENDILSQLLDSAIVNDGAFGRLAMTIDGYVVTPWKFPGGNIGKLAVCGTLNDLAVCGAKPLGLALSVILAEGFPIADFDEIMAAVGATAQKAGVKVVTGDTKVVGRGQADGIYIVTAGVGRVPAARELSPKRVAPGNVLIINGPVGEHGLAVMLAREMPEVKSVLTSDVAPLNTLIQGVLEAVGGGVKFMRDPTRGGLAGLCADLARQSGCHVVMDEAAIPVRPEARHAADMLGLDPLEIANEGKVVLVVDAPVADRVLEVMRKHPLGSGAVAIGAVTEPRDGVCEVKTMIGGRRIVQKPYGEQLPRIC